MEQLLNSKLVVNALNRLSKEDYLANAILMFCMQRNQMPVASIDLTDENKGSLEDLLVKMKKLGDSSLKLTKMFKENLTESDLKKVNNINNPNELTAIYLLKNIKKLCPSKSYERYYDRINNLVSKLDKDFSYSMQLGLILRSIHIMEKFINKGNLEALEMFLTYLECSKDRFDQLLNNIYYGIYDKYIQEELPTDNPSEMPDEEETKYDNPKIYNALLNSNDILPDSIIEKLCTDEQFKGYDPNIIIFLMNRFFRFELGDMLADDDLLDVIQRIFNNNVRDFGSKAEFLNLTNLLDMSEGYFQGYTSCDELSSELAKIVTGINILGKVRKEDDNNYGTI